MSRTPYSPYHAVIEAKLSPSDGLGETDVRQ
jgi:hypothetical protein